MKHLCMLLGCALLATVSFAQDSSAPDTSSQEPTTTFKSNVKLVSVFTTVVNKRGELEVHTTALSYFSRLADHETFGRLATVETHRRGTETAGVVCAVVVSWPACGGWWFCWCGVGRTGCRFRGCGR